MSKNGDDDEFKIDHYGVLGLKALSTVEEVNKAARKLSRKYHPDKNPSPEAAALFLQIQRSKDFLTDNEKRTKYDKALETSLKRKAYEDQRKAQMDESRVRAKAVFEARLAAASRNGDAEKEQRAQLKQMEEEIVRQRRTNVALVAAANEEAMDKIYSGRSSRAENSDPVTTGQSESDSVRSVKRARRQNGVLGLAGTEPMSEHHTPPADFAAFTELETNILAQIRQCS